jgi:hypothetical protein
VICSHLEWLVDWSSRNVFRPSRSAVAVHARAAEPALALRLVVGALRERMAVPSTTIISDLDCNPLNLAFESRKSRVSSRSVGPGPATTPSRFADELAAFRGQGRDTGPG